MQSNNHNPDLNEVLEYYYNVYELHEYSYIKINNNSKFGTNNNQF